MKKVNSSLKRRPYDNYEVYHPDGTLMFFCSQRKVNWYLNRDLAIPIDNNKVKLTFTPGGYGDPHILLEGRQNICVIKGISIGLTKHHVVPYQFRKHFKLKYKDKNSYDLCVLCRDAHDEYELYANDFKEQLYNDYIDPLNIEINNLWYHAKSLYTTIQKHYDKIPPAKQIYLTMKFEGLCEKYNFNIEDFKNTNSPYSDNNNKIIIDKIGTENLIVLWKLHFIKFGKPQFLPEWWKPNYLKIIDHKRIGTNNKKTDLKKINLVKNTKLLKLIFKYDLYEVARLYI